MSEQQDFSRWRDEAPPGFDEAAAQYRGIGPDADMLEHMLAGVEAQIALDATPPAQGPSSVAQRVWSKKFFGMAVLLLAGGAWLALRSDAHEPAKIAIVAAPVVSRAPVVVAPQPVVVAPAPTPTPESAPVSKVRSVRRAAPPPQVVAVQSAPEPVAEAAPSPLAELALLRRARRVLPAQPAQALELTEQHAREFAKGVFAEEREVLAIEALLKLGRRADAQTRADAFLRSHEGSLHARRVHVLLDETP